MLSFNLLLPVLEFIVFAVVNAENMFGAGQGDQKRVQVWTEACDKLYDLIDSGANFSTEIDLVVKNLIIPQAIQFIVDYCKQNGFDMNLKDAVLKHIEPQISKLVEAQK